MLVRSAGVREFADRLVRSVWPERERGLKGEAAILNLYWERVRTPMHPKCASSSSFLHPPSSAEAQCAEGRPSPLPGHAERPQGRR